MKIIRKRKGFTTNSSAAMEWVPPEATSTGGAGTTPVPGSEGPLMTLPPLRGTTQQPAALPGWLKPDSPLVRIGFIGLLILFLFIVEEIIRRAWKEMRKKKDEE